MRTRQLSDLRLDIRKLAGVEGATTFIPDADVTELWNQAWTRVYGVLKTSGEPYYRTRFTFSTTANAPTYYSTASANTPAVLPTDIWDVDRIDVQDAAGFWRNMHRLEGEQRNDFQFSGGVLLDVPRFYEFEQMSANTSLTVYPTPGVSSTTIRLTYWPSAARLSNDTDTIDGGNGWERWAIAIAARWVAVKDENYELVAQLDQEIAQWEQSVKADAQSRSLEEAPKMRRSRYARRRLFPWPYGGGGDGFGGW